MKKVLAVVLAILCCFACTACDRGQGEKIDPTKTQIYVAMYNGGLGEEWMNQIEAKFEEKYPEYQVITDPSKDSYDSMAIYNNFAGYRQDLFLIDYMSLPTLQMYIKAGYAADISDIVVNQKLTEYSEDVSIYEKMNDSLKGYFYSDFTQDEVSGEVIYALPWYQASYQCVYDKALFSEYELYKDEDGDWNDGSDKHLGIDGKESYDDGLPRTVSEFKELIERMKSNEVGVTPFTMYGRGDYYFDSYMSSIFADYEGYNDFMLTNTANGTDSDIGEVTPDNYYRLKSEQKGRRFATDIAYYIAHDSNNYTANTFSTSQLHTTAQREFLLSKETNKPVAMLIEGGWWENEAKDVMTQMADRYHDEGYAYGVREFGVMPIPQSDEGDPFYTSSNERLICCNTAGSVQLVNGKHTAEQIANAKKLLKFMHSNEALEISVAYTNVSVPYTVNMDKHYSDMLTPYSREMQEIFADPDVKVVYEAVPASDFLKNEGNGYCSYLSLFSVSGSFQNPATLNFLPNTTYTVADYITAMADSYIMHDYNENLRIYHERIGA